jgi:Fibrobacter succinogenes major domain (Fib_succ_major).
MLKYKFLLPAAYFMVFAVALSCSSFERDNPFDYKSANYKGGIVPLSSSSASPSSSSVVPSSSSSEIASSSSSEQNSSSSETASSSSFEQSSSSEITSSSSSEQSSSSSVDLCADFVDEPREHYGKSKAQFCDSRDGKKYVYVTIDTQTWMAENLNYNTTDSKCYDYSEANCTAYGSLYNWTTAMGVCPSGWHLPSKAEWEKLKSVVGNKLNEYDFTALLSGYYENGDFGGLTTQGVWWNTDQYNTDRAYNHYIRSSAPNNLLSNIITKKSLVSVRCIKD